jgi:hypothetical protein
MFWIQFTGRVTNLSGRVIFVPPAFHPTSNYLCCLTVFFFTVKLIMERSKCDSCPYPNET